MFEKGKNRNSNPLTMDELDMQERIDDNVEKIIRKFCNIGLILVLLLGIALIWYHVTNPDKTTVSAKTVVPYDQVKNEETIYMQKSFNKKKDCWDTYTVKIYEYECDGFPGLYVTCTELNQSMDFYGFDSYEVLNTEHKDNSKDNPSFNIKLYDMSDKDKKDCIYIHPDSYTECFMIVQ